jgi:hypothetical protein
MTAGGLRRIALVYVVPGLCVGLAVLFVVLAAISYVPEADELEPRAGRLRSYLIVEHYRSRDQVILQLDDGTRVWTDAIDSRQARELFRSGPIQIGTSVLKASPYPYRRIAGGVKSFALIVNGRVIRSQEAAIERERALVRVGFPLLALMFAAIAVAGHFVQKRKFDRPAKRG